MKETELREELKKFDEHPRAAMMALPRKRDRADIPLPSGSIFFTEEDIESGDYIDAKNDVRRALSTRGPRVRALRRAVEAPIEETDRPEDLVDQLKYRKLADIDAAGLRRASLAETPWSGDYWPTYAGGLGKRYADPAFPASVDWKKNYEYFQKHPVQAIVASGDLEAIDRLSPSEKYDLLIGDADGALTDAMWDEGKRYYERTGKVETWMGICDGWAAASYLLRRPRRGVTVKAADGRTDLRFFPSDIKALASLLWARANVANRYIGSRSNEKNPPVDEVGRVLSPSAFDTNPGTWHLSVVNQIAVSKRSFIMDATYDYEVWNQPVHAYEYTYFNPQTLEPAPSLESAAVSRALFTKDKFRKYRSEGFASVVGVSMTVTYVVESAPTHEESDEPSRDVVSSVDYRYDIELDAEGQVLGGEWYQNAHPDFLWTPPPGARALTPADRHAAGRWAAPAPLPEAWRRAAASVSARSLPLGRIVEQLIELANA
jgi:hypothetical protein